MDSALGLLLIGFVVWWIYQRGHGDGKRLGSRKAYGVGLAKGRRGRGGDACFVATAVFERDAHPALRLLRRYRDVALLSRRWGQALVWLYYQVGPLLASVVRRIPRAKRWIRRALLGWCWTHRRRIRGTREIDI